MMESLTSFILFLLVVLDLLQPREPYLDVLQLQSTLRVLQNTISRPNATSCGSIRIHHDLHQGTVYQKRKAHVSGTATPLGRRSQ